MSNLTNKEAKDIMQKHKNVLLVDVRSPDEYAISHLPGAINIPLEKYEDHRHKIKQKEHVIAYCNTGGMSAEFRQKAQDDQQYNIMSLAEGMIKRQKDGHDIIRKKRVLPLMRQVFITAGILILLGSILGYFIDSLFLIIPLFVGGGFVFSGISGFCGMTKLLALMPWNRA